MLELLGYLADAVILLAYGWLVTRDDPLPFHWANAVGGLALLAITLSTVGWQPLLVLTVAFTIAGWIGVARAHHQ